MILVGLTGGIGSGKSTVASLLARRGATVVDADAVARELQVPGAEAVTAIAARFPDVVDAHGVLDRAALARIVFNDAAALADLNSIMLPRIREEIRRRVEALRRSSGVVVLDIPLLAEGRSGGLSAILVVDVEPEVALERLVSARGMSESDARARMASQATREARLAVADRVVDNSVDLAELEASLDETWQWMLALPEASGEVAVFS
jgi:dephospho-CoA kinase